MIHPSDRRMKRRTDNWAIAYSALSIYAICCRALKSEKNESNKLRQISRKVINEICQPCSCEMNVWWLTDIS